MAKAQAGDSARGGEGAPSGGGQRGGRWRASRVAAALWRAVGARRPEGGAAMPRWSAARQVLGPGPEHRAEREPEPQPEPGPGRGPGPQGRAARSGGDGASAAEGFLPAPAGGRLSKPPQPGSAGIPHHHIQDPETFRKASGPPAPTEIDQFGESDIHLYLEDSDLPAGSADSPSSVWALLRPRTQ